MPRLHFLRIVPCRRHHPGLTLSNERVQECPEASLQQALDDSSLSPLDSGCLLMEGVHTSRRSQLCRIGRIPVSVRHHFLEKTEKKKDPKLKQSKNSESTDLRLKECSVSAAVADLWSMSWETHFYLSAQRNWIKKEVDRDPVQSAAGLLEASILNASDFESYWSLGSGVVMQAWLECASMVTSDDWARAKHCFFC